MRRGSPEKKENEPSPLGSASPLLWGRPALPPRGCAIRCKKKKKRKKRKREADERGRKLGRKKIKEGKAEKEVGEEGREEKRET